MLNQGAITSLLRSTLAPPPQQIALTPAVSETQGYQSQVDDDIRTTARLSVAH